MYIGLVHVLVPFMVLSISAVLQGVDVRLEESARVLGAGRFSTRSCTSRLPLSLDGIATGCLLTFVVTNGSFLTMLLLGGGKITTLSLLIYQQFTTTQDVGVRRRDGQCPDAGGGDLLCPAVPDAAPPGRARMMRWPGLPVALLFGYMALFMLFIILPIAAVVVAVSFSSSSFIVFPIPGLHAALVLGTSSNTGRSSTR